MVTLILCRSFLRISFLVTWIVAGPACSQSDAAGERLAERLRESQDVIEIYGAGFEDPGLRAEFQKFRDMLDKTTAADLAKARIGFAFVNPVARDDKALIAVHWIAAQPQADAVRLMGTDIAIEIPIPEKQRRMHLEEAQSVVFYIAGLWIQRDQEIWGTVDNLTSAQESRVVLLKEGKEISQPHRIIRVHGEE